MKISFWPETKIALERHFGLRVCEVQVSVEKAKTLPAKGSLSGILAGDELSIAPKHCPAQELSGNPFRGELGRSPTRK